MKKLLILLSFIFTLTSYSQDLNKYSYVVVPEQFSFLKEADQYQLNSLTKFLFEKYGFETFTEGEESYLKLSPDRCEGLYADVINDSGLFRTKLQVTLKDCRNQQVFISSEGVSRQKDYGTAYQEALREAFESIAALDYSNNEVIVAGTPDLQVKTGVGEERVVETSSAEVKEKVAIVQTSEAKEKTNNAIIAEAVKKENQNAETTSEIELEKTTEVQVSKAQKSTEMNFTRDGRKFFLQKTDNGFNMFQEGMTEPFASLISSATGDNYVYTSMTSKGMAHRNDRGDLIIEILKNDNSLETIVYKSKGQ